MFCCLLLAFYSMLNFEEFLKGPYNLLFCQTSWPYNIILHTHLSICSLRMTHPRSCNQTPSGSQIHPCLSVCDTVRQSRAGRSHDSYNTTKSSKQGHGCTAQNFMNQARNYNLKIALFMLVQRGLVGRVNT